MADRPIVRADPTAAASFKTAIARPGPSAPAKKLTPCIERVLAESSLNPSVRGVLDYGCGRGADVNYFRSLGIDAGGYDPHAPFGFAESPTGVFMVVTLIFVLNVLPDRGGSAGGDARGHRTSGARGRANRGDTIHGGHPKGSGSQRLAGLGRRVRLARTPRHLPARHGRRGDSWLGRDARPAAPAAAPDRARHVARGALATNAHDGTV